MKDISKPAFEECGKCLHNRQGFETMCCAANRLRKGMRDLIDAVDVKHWLGPSEGCSAFEEDWLGKRDENIARLEKLTDRAYALTILSLIRHEANYFGPEDEMSLWEMVIRWADEGKKRSDILRALEREVRYIQHF